MMATVIVIHIFTMFQMKKITILHSLTVSFLILLILIRTIRLKSDNCSTQYKCKYIFGKYKELAMDTGVLVIAYYGASGHGKGLVDAMSGFGVKGPIRKAVITEDFHYEFFHYECACDIVLLLKNLFHDDPHKQYFELSTDEISTIDETILKSVNIMKHHMVSFFPDGSVQIKINMCSCENCLIGDFINCMFDPGVQVCSKLLAIDDSNSESDSNNEFEEDDVEEQVIRGNCILELLECEKFIALFSPPSANELFYILVLQLQL